MRKAAARIAQLRVNCCRMLQGRASMAGWGWGWDERGSRRTEGEGAGSAKRG